MRQRRKLRAFRSLHSADRLLVCEAAVLLALTCLIVLTVPFRVMAPWLARAPETDSCDDALLLRVRRAVTMAARNVPWKAVCLPQAMAAKVMLARRGHGSSLHMGASFDGNGKLIAHAWLVTRRTVVVGAGGISAVAPLARFG